MCHASPLDSAGEAAALYGTLAGRMARAGDSRWESNLRTALVVALASDAEVGSEVASSGARPQEWVASPRRVTALASDAEADGSGGGPRDAAPKDSSGTYAAPRRGGGGPRDEDDGGTRPLRLLCWQATRSAFSDNTCTGVIIATAGRRSAGRGRRRHATVTSPLLASDPIRLL